MNTELKRQRFLNLLQKAGLTAASLAREAKLPSPSAIYNFTNGRSEGFDFETIEKMAPVLGVEPGNFWKDPPTPQGGLQAPALLGDAGYAGKNQTIFIMAEMWETLTATQQDQFLAMAMVTKKEPDKAGAGKRDLPLSDNSNPNEDGSARGGASRSDRAGKKTRTS